MVSNITTTTYQPWLTTRAMFSHLSGFGLCQSLCQLDHWQNPHFLSKTPLFLRCPVRSTDFKPTIHRTLNSKKDWKLKMFPYPNLPHHRGYPHLTILAQCHCSWSLDQPTRSKSTKVGLLWLFLVHLGRVQQRQKRQMNSFESQTQ